MMPEEWGLAGEFEAAHWAALWGLPDLVYKAEVTRNREPGDALLANGLEGLIVQVKTRIGYGIDDKPEQIARWINREIKKANKQFAGSRRMLTEHGDVQGISLRDGFERVFPKEMHWKGVIILVVQDDYLPENIYPSQNKDTLILTIQDWMHLCKATRSVYGVITYIDRATRDVPKMLEDACRELRHRDLPSYTNWSEWGELAKHDSDINDIIEGLIVPLGQEYDRFRTFSDMDVREATKNGTLPIFRPPHLQISDEANENIERVMEWIHGDLSSMNGLKIRSVLGQIKIDRREEYCREAIELLDKLPLSAKIMMGSRMKLIQKAAAKGESGAADMIAPDLWPGYILYVADYMSRWSTGILDPEQRMLVFAMDMFEALCLPDSTDEPVLVLAEIYNNRKKNTERICAFIGNNQNSF